jgi:bifunctional DNA-binding transcriptional regulator/antitoxin component of YhaV-PrlF toxin-antitoxin module
MTTVALTSKNQITLPVKLVRQAGLWKGMRFTPRIQGSAIVLEPQQGIREAAAAAQLALKPFIKRPLSNDMLQRALHDWN